MKFGFAKLFLLPAQPKWAVRKYDFHYRTTDGKLREIMACGSFSSTEIVLFMTVYVTSNIAEVISSRANLLHRRVYPLIDECFARLRQDFKTMYEEMERTTKDESGKFRK